MKGSYTTARGAKFSLDYPDWMEEDQAVKLVEGCLDATTEKTRTYWYKRKKQLGVELYVGGEGYEIR